LSGRGRALAAGVALAAVAAVVVTLSVGGSADSGEEPGPPPRSFFGVVPQGGLFAEDLERMGRGKVGTIRLHLPWAVLDPTEADDYAFESIDGVILEAAKNGIEVVPFMFGTPAWAAERDGHTDCLPDCATYAPRSPEALEPWNEFLEALVERYGPGGEIWKANPDVDPVPVHAWQIWNEQNSATFYKPRPDAQGYADLLASSEEAIHSVDPEAEIILGGMFGTPPDGTDAWDYLAELYETGAEQSFDAIAVHPYGGQVDKLELQVELMREQVNAAGDEAATWITEIGWASSGPPNPYNKGPQGQAEQLEAAYGLLMEKRLEWEIENVSWYSWRDVADSPCEWCGGSGLFPEDSLERPKPSWESYVALTGGS
jgi:hypothetical protein